MCIVSLMNGCVGGGSRETCTYTYLGLGFKSKYLYMYRKEAWAMGWAGLWAGLGWAGYMILGRYKIHVQRTKN